MLKVHLNDGKTLKFQLSDPVQLADWLNRSKSYAFQNRITGMTIINNGVSYSIPKPRDFNDVSFSAEGIEYNLERKMKGGERVMCHAGDIELSLTAYNSQKAARIDVSRPGKQTFNPLSRGR